MFICILTTRYILKMFHHQLTHLIIINIHCQGSGQRWEYRVTSHVFGRSYSGVTDLLGKNDSKWLSKEQWKIVTIMKNAPILDFHCVARKLKWLFNIHVNLGVPPLAETVVVLASRTRVLQWQIVTVWVLTCVHWSHFRSHFFFSKRSQESLFPKKWS